MVIDELSAVNICLLLNFFGLLPGVCLFYVPFLLALFSEGPWWKSLSLGEVGPLLAFGLPIHVTFLPISLTQSIYILNLFLGMIVLHRIFPKFQNTKKDIDRNLKLN